MTERRLRAYVCGPMAGHPGLNADQFAKAEWLIAQRGEDAVVPHNLGPYEHPHLEECSPVYGHRAELPDGTLGHDGGCYLRGDVAVMVMCDYIFRLPGWEGSRGAKIETRIAAHLGIPVEDADPDELAAAPVGVGQG